MTMTNLLTLKSLKTMLALLLVVFLGTGLFSACSKADAKKEKSKKSKAQTEEDEESEEKTASKEEESKEKESKEKDSAEKKTPDEKKPAEKKVSHEAIWNELVKGNKRFMAGKHTTINYSAMRASLAKGQKPDVIVLGCADSRVPPELVFDKNLGELFVIREAGNIADEVSLGSIEYAIEHLHTKMIVVLGHESCGAVAAAVSGEKMPTKNLTEIVQMIAPAFEDSKDCVIGEKPNMQCVELNADHSAKDLLLKSPIIKKAVEEGEVEIVSAVYHFDTGEVVRLK